MNVAMNINDQARRIQRQRGVIAGAVGGLNHNARSSRLVLRHAYFSYYTVVHVKILAQEPGGKPRVFQVEENAVRMIKTLGFELYVLLKVNRDPCVIGVRRMLHPGDAHDAVARIITVLRRRIFC